MSTTTPTSTSRRWRRVLRRPAATASSCARTATAMAEREVTIINKLGLHARAAAKLVTLASQYSSDIRVAKGSREVSGKSIMSVMMLAAAKDSRIRLIAEGDDAEQALAGLEELVNRRFDEDA